MVLAKRTSKNQLTLPNAVVEQVGAADYQLVAALSALVEPYPPRWIRNRYRKWLHFQCRLTIDLKAVVGVILGVDPAAEAGILHAQPVQPAEPAAPLVLEG